MDVCFLGMRLRPAAVRFFSTSKHGYARFGSDRRQDDIERKSAADIQKDEDNGIFRVLDIGKPKPFEERAPLARSSQHLRGPSREKVMKPDQDWGNVWPAARTFHPDVVPLPVRQGVTQIKDQVIPSKYANAELMKIPNFLHLTPPVIKKHCAALRKFCTAWPEGLDSEDQINKHFPLQVTTSDYLNSTSTIRDRRSRIVVTQFHIDSLELDDHAKDKMIRLLGHRYESETGLVSFTTDRCPYRGQNLDYANYLVTALYFEAWKTEAWEERKDDADLEWYSLSEEEKQQEDAGEFGKTLQRLLNEGEDEASLRAYKEIARKTLNLPAQNVKAEVVG